MQAEVIWPILYELATRKVNNSNLWVCSPEKFADQFESDNSSFLALFGT